MRSTQLRCDFKFNKYGAPQMLQKRAIEGEASPRRSSTRIEVPAIQGPLLPVVGYFEFYLAMPVSLVDLSQRHESLVVLHESPARKPEIERDPRVETSDAQHLRRRDARGAGKRPSVAETVLSSQRGTHKVPSISGDCSTK